MHWTPPPTKRKGTTVNNAFRRGMVASIIITVRPYMNCTETWLIPLTNSSCLYIAPVLFPKLPVKHENCRLATISTEPCTFQPKQSQVGNQAMHWDAKAESQALTQHPPLASANQTRRAANQRYDPGFSSAHFRCNCQLGSSNVMWPDPMRS